tara:strand:+ start:289 stop:501 length:213 start_codon:yes stop_codon:yes gene_type:complete
MTVPKKKDFIKISECGRYGLLTNTELWKIAGKHSYMAGYVMNPENLEYAVDTAEEEMAALLADARMEFGF